MATTSELLKRYEAHSASAKDAPIEIEKAIKKAYEGPVKQLIEEGNAIRPEAYSSFFNAFGDMGTGAADMSPAARLGSAIQTGERGMSRLRNNTDIRNYYGTLINDLVGKGLSAYQMGGNSLKDLYQMQMSQDQFEWQKQEAEKQRAAAARARAGSGGGFTPLNLEAFDIPGPNQNVQIDHGMSGGSIPGMSTVTPATGGGLIDRVRNRIGASGNAGGGFVGGARSYLK